MPNIRTEKFSMARILDSAFHFACATHIILSHKADAIRTILLHHKKGSMENKMRIPDAHTDDA